MAAVLPSRDPPPRVCVATLYDSRFAPIGDFCRTSLVEYGRRHGYDVVYAAGIDTGRPMSWEKLPFIESLFDAGYDYVFWIDADALVVDPSRPIDELLKPDKALYVVRHTINNRPCVNMGVFLLRNCEWSRRLLRDLGCLKRYLHHPWWETAAMKHLLHRDLFADMSIVNLEGPWLDDAPIEWVHTEWNHIPRHSPKMRPVIKHFAGSKFRKRLKRMLLNCRPLRQLWLRATTRWAPLDASRYPAQVALPRQAWRDTPAEPLRRAA
ncbi:MAG: DUF273 domain-containing protein [Lacipirellulaceae bacterium]